jgi:hypothetical protein
MNRFLIAFIASFIAIRLFADDPKPKPHGLSPVDLKQNIVWSSTAEGEDGFALSFGGMDQSAPDGVAHTRIKENGQWRDIHEELRKNNPLQPQYERLRRLRNLQKELTARIRSIYFEDPSEKAEQIFQGLLIASFRGVSGELDGIIGDLKKPAPDLSSYQLSQRSNVADSLAAIASRASELSQKPPSQLTPQLVTEMFHIQLNLEQAAEWLNCEPPPRALSPLLYIPSSKQFLLFGGDHLDYLTNDTWVFLLQPMRWERRFTRSAPPPRANHTLALSDEGDVIIAGGYTYANNTDYTGGQYLDRNDGPWTADLLHDSWKSTTSEGVPAYSRLYRSGPFHPDFFLEGDKPDVTKFQAFLKNLPANNWTKTDPPRLPKLNRDWGTAILDTDRDLILRWSGGHSAHGGTDVLQYHRATNRWELPYPVEFPLGQLYSNTSYPTGVSFNGRAWITGHTYQNYAYDPISKKMIFTGQHKQFFPYDPDIEDWLGGQDKPKEMSYDSCFYTLTCTTTPGGIYCWTNDGKLLFYDSTKPAPWIPLTLTGEKLAGSSVDNSTVVHDDKRNRLLFFRKQYGDKTKYDGTMQSVDLNTLTVSTITPENAPATQGISYLCQIRYDSTNDLFLAGCTLPPDANNPRRTPAYDPGTNRWLSLKITGDDPSGKAGRNVSLGMMYDATRKLFWATDTNSQVYVLRLDPKTADAQPMQ